MKLSKYQKESLQRVLVETSPIINNPKENRFILYDEVRGYIDIYFESTISREKIAIRFIPSACAWCVRWGCEEINKYECDYIMGFSCRSEIELLEWLVVTEGNYKKYISIYKE